MVLKFFLKNLSFEKTWELWQGALISTPINKTKILVFGADFIVQIK
jgi:hypothetical protein